MAKITCSRCYATTQANSIEEGRKLLDHSIGLVIGKPCEDGKAELLITGKVTKPKTPKEDKPVGNKPKPDSIPKKD